MLMRLSIIRRNLDGGCQEDSLRSMILGIFRVLDLSLSLVIGLELIMYMETDS